MAQIIEQNGENHVADTSAPSLSTPSGGGVPTPEMSDDSPLPSLAGEDQTPANLANLTERARSYVEAASSANTRKAYASDWKHFAAWCRRSNLAPLPPHPQTVGLYITACASGAVEGGAKANSVSTIERRLSSLSWNYAQRGLTLDRRDRHIATVMVGIRNSHARPPLQKEAAMAEDIIAMIETLDRGTLRGLRDRAMLLIGYAGGLRRSEIVGLDLKAGQTEDGRGWIEIFDKGLLVTLRGKQDGARSRSVAAHPTLPVRSSL
jgi:site-specific recombinase XerD